MGNCCSSETDASNQAIDVERKKGMFSFQIVKIDLLISQKYI